MLEIIIDWLQFTSKDPSPINTIIHVLRLDVKSFIELPKGKLGYKRQMMYDNITVLFEGNDDMGTHVILSGKGCRTFERNEPIISLIERIKEYENKCTRIDIAIDDKEGNIIDLKKITHDIKNANVVSKWKTSLERTKRNLKDGQIVGKTIEIGSRSSELFLRIYDKAMEQKIDGKWARMEVEVKGRKAVNLQNRLTIGNVGEIATGLINNYIRIVQPNKKDVNKSRWETKPYWKKIINTTEKVSLSQKKEDATLEDIEKWIEKQVAPTLATIVMAKGGDMEYIYDQLGKGSKRLKAKHRSIINKEMNDLE